MDYIDEPIAPKYVVNRHVNMSGNPRNPYTPPFTVVNEKFLPIASEIMERTKLKEGWDGHDGIPVSNETAELAIRVVATVMNQSSPFPSVGAGSGGSIFMEWGQNDYEIRVEIDDSQEVHISRLNLKSEEDDEYYENIQNYFLLARWINNLTGNGQLKDTNMQAKQIITKNYESQFRLFSNENEPTRGFIPIKV